LPPFISCIWRTLVSISNLSSSLCAWASLQLGDTFFIFVFHDSSPPASDDSCEMIRFNIKLTLFGSCWITSDKKSQMCKNIKGKVRHWTFYYATNFCKKWAVSHQLLVSFCQNNFPTLNKMFGLINVFLRWTKYEEIELISTTPNQMKVTIQSRCCAKFMLEREAPHWITSCTVKIFWIEWNNIIPNVTIFWVAME
jgi:hypothetical protein